MRFVTAAVCLCFVSPALAQDAAHKLLTDPDAMFDSAKAEEAMAAEMKQKWADEKKADRQEQQTARQARRQGAKDAKTSKTAYKAPAAASLKPKRTWNKPRQPMPMPPWMQAWAQQAYLRANTPMMYVGPVVRYR